MNEDEYKAGCLLTIPQREVLQNELSELAERKLALTLDPNAPLLFTQDEAYIRGQMDSIRFILARDTTAKENL